MPQHAVSTSYKPGQSGNPEGRKRGSVNVVRRTLKELAAAIFLNPKVQSIVVKQAEEGKLNPRVLVEFMHYFEGDPPKTIRKEIVRTESDFTRAAQLLPEEERYQLADLLIKIERMAKALPAPKVVEAKVKRVNGRVRRAITKTETGRGT